MIEDITIDIEASYDVLDKCIDDPVKTKEFLQALPKLFCRCCGRTNPPCMFDTMMSGVTAVGKPSYISPFMCNDCCNWRGVGGKLIGKSKETIDPWVKRYNKP